MAVKHDWKAIILTRYKIAWEVWTPIIVGYVWVTGSYILPLPPNLKEASGSILVAATIIAQLLYDSLEWRRELAHLEPGTSINLTAYEDSKDGRSKFATATVMVTSIDPNPSKHDHVEGLLRTRKNRFSLLMELGAGDTTEDSEWYYQKTKQRVEYWIAFTLALSVFIGTVIWGYGISSILVSVCLISMFIAYVVRPKDYVGQ